MSPIITKLLLAITISAIINSSHSQVLSSPMPSVPGQNTGFSNLGKVVGGAYAAKKVWQHKGKILILGGVSLLAFGFTKAKLEYIVQHPEEAEDFVSDHPLITFALMKWVDHNIRTNEDTESRQIFENFRDYLFLDTQNKQAYEIANHPNWIKYEALVQNKISIENNVLNQQQNFPSLCGNGVVIRSLVEMKDLTVTVSNYTTPQLFSMDSYSNLRRNINLSGMQYDHIPSYAAVRSFLRDKGIVVHELKGGRNRNLANNTSAIVVTPEIHKLGRTFAGKNIKLITFDSKNLLAATILDITVLSVALSLNSPDPVVEQYINSGVKLFARNKMLCLYD